MTSAEVESNERVAPRSPMAAGVASFTTREAAKLLEVSPRSLEAWRLAEPPVGPRPYRVGRAVRYALGEIARFQREATGA